MVWHISPLAGDDTILEENDIVKVYLGCHIDDIISIVSHTHVVQEGPINGREANVIAAANTTVKVALILDEPQKGDSKLSMGIGFV
jgi:methionine aminopeptidase